MMQFDPFDPFHPSNVHILKIQHGGGRHLEKSKNRHIAAIHRVSKTSDLWLANFCYNFDTHEQILIFLAEMLPIK